MSLPGFLSEEEHCAQPSKRLPGAPDQNNPPEMARGKAHKSARLAQPRKRKTLKARRNTLPYGNRATKLRVAKPRS
jgi:hypothetical protein